MKRMICIILLLGLVCVPVLAQNEDEAIKKHPGYVNFDDIEVPKDAEESVEVYVRGPLLKLVASATKNEDPALSDLLAKLLLVRVNTFTLDEKSAEELKPKVARIEASLGAKNWEKVARVKERAELTNVYMKMEGERIVGLVVMVVESSGDSNEAVFVNIVGEIDMDAIGKLGRKFDIPTLETWDEEKH